MPRILRICYTTAALGIAALVGFAWLLAGNPSLSQVFDLYRPKGLLTLLGVGYALGWGIYFSINSSKCKEKLARCALTSGTLLTLLIMLELPAALNIIDYQQYLLTGGGIPVGVQSLNAKWWRFDPELIHIRHPHQHITGETSGDIRLVPPSAKRIYPVDAKYDANGFRNSADLDEASVVLIGDSFLEAGLVPEEEIVASHLQRRLGVTVENLGVTMYGPQQEFAALRRYGVRLNPRLVLWFFFEGNDLADAIVYEERRKILARDLNGFKQRSFLKNATNVLIEWISPESPNSGDLYSCEVRQGESTVRMYFRYAGAPLSENDVGGLELTKDILLTARKLAHDNGTEFVLVYVPTKFRVYQNQCAVFPVNSFTKDWRLSDLPDRIRSWCEAQGISFLDLTPAFREHAAERKLLYFLDDSHWNPLGNEVAAAIIGKFIDEHGWLKTQKSPSGRKSRRFAD